MKNTFYSFLALTILASPTISAAEGPLFAVHLTNRLIPTVRVVAKLNSDAEIPAFVDGRLSVHSSTGKIRSRYLGMATLQEALVLDDYLAWTDKAYGFSMSIASDLRTLWLYELATGKTKCIKLDEEILPLGFVEKDVCAAMRFVHGKLNAFGKLYLNTGKFIDFPVAEKSTWCGICPHASGLTALAFNPKSRRVDVFSTTIPLSCRAAFQVPQEQKIDTAQAINAGFAYIDQQPHLLLASGTQIVEYGLEQDQPSLDELERLRKTAREAKKIARVAATLRRKELQQKKAEGQLLAAERQLLSRPQKFVARALDITEIRKNVASICGEQSYYWPSRQYDGASAELERATASFMRPWRFKSATLERRTGWAASLYFSGMNFMCWDFQGVDGSRFSFRQSQLGGSEVNQIAVMQPDGGVESMGTITIVHSPQEFFTPCALYNDNLILSVGHTYKTLHLYNVDTGKAELLHLDQQIVPLWFINADECAALQFDGKHGLTEVGTFNLRLQKFNRIPTNDGCCRYNHLRVYGFFPYGDGLVPLIYDATKHSLQIVVRASEDLRNLIIRLPEEPGGFDFRVGNVVGFRYVNNTPRLLIANNGVATEYVLVEDESTSEPDEGIIYGGLS